MADNQPRPEWGGFASLRLRTLIRGWVLLLTVALACGCNGPSRRSSEVLKKYFPDDAPESALVGFVFAVETGDWDIAYSRLSATSREKIGPFQFKYGLPLYKDPRTGITVLEIITESIHDRSLIPRVPGQPDNLARIQVNYYGKDTKGRIAAYLVVIYLVDEREAGSDVPAWRIDLLKTAERLSGT